MSDRREGWVWLWSKGEKGGVTHTPNLRHVRVRRVEYKRVWEEGGGWGGGGCSPHLSRHHWGARAAEVWLCAPAQLSLSCCRLWGCFLGGGGGVADYSLCCGLASKASTATYILCTDRGAGRGEAWKEGSKEAENM